MSFFYNSFDIYTNGIITEEVIPLDADGKRVQFNLANPLAKKLFMVIENELRAFDNGSKMSTPVKGLNKLYQFFPHMGNLIVIDTKPVTVSLNDSLEFPFSINSKKTILLDLQTDMDITFGISDPELLAIWYCEGRVSDPCELIKRTLKSAFKRVAKKTITATQERYFNAPLNFVYQLQAAEDDMADAIKALLSSELPFIRLDDFQIDFSLINSNAIIAAVNEDYELRKMILTRFIEIICDNYKTSVFPVEISQILTSYVQANPGGVTVDQLSFICSKLIALTRKASPDEMIQAAQHIGLLS